MSAPWMPPLPEMHDDEALLMDADELRQLQADAARAALEQAALVCRQRASRWKNRPVPMLGYAAELDDAADAIEALAKEITP